MIFFEKYWIFRNLLWLCEYQVSKAKTKVFPAATHVDNTARVQTVTKKQNKKYYTLLKEFEKVQRREKGWLDEMKEIAGTTGTEIDELARKITEKENILKIKLIQKISEK